MSTNNIIFKSNLLPTMGVELELQLVGTQYFNLAMEAEDFLRRLNETPHSGEIKPEVTQSMIEINSSIHTEYSTLFNELLQLKDVLINEANQTHILICGGGTHPFQKWKQQRIFPTDRFEDFSEQYGYLAKQFTVFGLHIHIGCKNGDDALYLCHAMARYLPHFIALSAASPFNQAIDTSFDCSRLTIVSTFPLSGTPPWLQSWEEFNIYFANMVDLQVVKTMKDFYWDIRPKPEYGTVELRICDTPLTIAKAADLAAYAQMLASWLLHERKLLFRETYLTYAINRFRAARYGFEANIVDPIYKITYPLSQDILSTCEKVQEHAVALRSVQALTRVQAAAQSKRNGAGWLRAKLIEESTLADVVRAQCALWKSSHEDI